MAALPYSTAAFFHSISKTERVAVAIYKKNYSSSLTIPRQAIKFFHASTASSSSSDSKFSFGIAASYSAKHCRFDFEENVFQYSPTHTDNISEIKSKKNRPASGQDAFFVSRVGKTSDMAMGIADGVGGWDYLGVDPADFSHGICSFMAQAALTYQVDKQGSNLGALSLMQRGYDDLCHDQSVFAGSSTACVAVARGNGILEVANLGDSGFVQLRLNAIHSYTDPQTHAFNTPYQLSIVPEREKYKSATFAGPHICDLPKDANVLQHDLRHGDVFVFGTDGIWDNLSRSEILKIVSRTMLKTNAWEYTDDGVKVGKGLPSILGAGGGFGRIKGAGLQSTLAIGITSEAKAASINTMRDGPFAKEVQKFYPREKWKGGKVDDICVLVAIVCETIQ